MPWSIFDIADIEKEIGKLEEQSAQPDFWLDQANAQGVMRQLSENKKTVQQLKGVNSAWDLYS